MVDKDFANWLLTQLEKRRLSNPEREWFDEYMTRSRSKLGHKQQKPWVSTLLMLGWGLAVALTLGLGALTWLL
jgi:hypothetical protein